MDSGIIDFQLSSSSSRYLSYYLDYSAYSASGYTYYLDLYNGTVITSWRVSYMFYDSSIITFMSVGSITTTYTASNAIASGSGYRTYKSVTTFSTGPIDLTHTVYIMPFHNGVILYRASANDSFQFKVTLEIINATSYYRIHATDGTCQVKSASQYRLTYDQTAVQMTQQTYLDAVFFTASNSVPNAYSLTFSDPTNYHCGIN